MPSPPSPGGPMGPAGPGMPTAPPTPEQIMEMLNGPAGPAPSGIASNFDHPESRVALATGLISFILALMIICVSLRVYSKVFITKAFGWDDWACIVAAIFNIGYAAIAFIALGTGGLGLHIWDIRLKNIANDKYFNTLIASSALYPLAILFTKLSILLLVYHIFWAKHRAVILVWIGIVVNTLFYGITFILSVVWCAPPVGGSPMLSAGGPKCQVDVKTLTVVQAGFNIGSDIYLLLIPIPLVLGLKTTLGKKIKVSFIFAVGLLSTILSALTLYYRVDSFRTIDTPWVYIPVYICSIFELNLGVICACLPCFPPLLHTAGMQRLMSSRSWLALSSRFSTTKSSDLQSKDKSDYSDITNLKENSQHEGASGIVAETSFGFELTDHGKSRLSGSSMA